MTKFLLFFFALLCLAEPNRTEGVLAPDAGRARVRQRRIRRRADAGEPGARHTGAGAGYLGQRAVHAPGHVHHPAGLRPPAGHLTVSVRFFFFRVECLLCPFLFAHIGIISHRYRHRHRHRRCHPHLFLRVLYTGV